MRFIIYTVGCLFLLVFITECKQEKEHPCTSQIDSLLYQLDSLNREISSGGIRRISDFSEEIRSDLTLIDSSGLYPPEPGVREEIDNYAYLGSYIDSCIRSCSAFHQEIVLLESDLQSLAEKMASEEPPDSLDKLISGYQEDINELAFRIDTTLNRSMKLVEEYFLVKPRIETIKQQHLASGSEPDEAAD